MTQQSVIFVVGEPIIGKSTIIRSLTGAARNQIYNLKNGSGELVRAFVFLSSIQEIGMTEYLPAIFLEKIESEWEVERDSYDIFICPLRLAVRDQATYGYESYIQSMRDKGFDVKIAIIDNNWNNAHADPHKIANIKDYAHKNGIALMVLDTSNDPNSESAKIKSFYP